LESPLSDPPDSESSDGEDNGDTPDTPKTKRGGGKNQQRWIQVSYNLQKALNWEEKQFGDLTEFVKNLVVDKLDLKRCHSKQNAVDLEEVIQSTAYSKDWPIRDALKFRLKYT